jgi:F-type H+-transporting ATPase subunit delta
VAIKTSSDAAVQRHARALLDVAERTGDPDRVDAEISALAGAMTGDAEVARVLGSSMLGPGRRMEALRGLAAAAGLSDDMTKLLLLLAERAQLDTLPALASAYHARLMERRNIVTAEVTTAVPLAPEAADALARRLGEVTGKEVRLSARIDASILGGVVARVGSVVYDGSVSGQLARMRQKLVENV